jgi:chromosome segregation ATPase
MLPSPLVLSIFGALALVAFAIGWAVRAVSARKHAAELQRGIYAAKGSVPQLESTIKNREQQIARLEIDIDELRASQATFNGALKKKEVEINSKTREVRNLASELQAIKTGGEAAGEVMLPGEDVSEALDMSPEVEARYRELEGRYDSLKHGLFERDDQIDTLRKQLAGDVAPDANNDDANEANEAHKAVLAERDEDIANLQKQLAEEKKEREMLAGFAKSRGDANRQAREKNANMEAALPKFEETIEARDAIIGKREESIHNLLEETETLKRLQKAQAKHIGDLKETIATQNTDIASFNNALSERDRRIAALDTNLATSEEALIATNSTVQTREAAIIKQQGNLESARAEVAELGQNANAMVEAVKDRDFKIEGLEQEAAKLGETLQQMAQALAAERAKHDSSSEAFDAAAEQAIKSLESTVAQLNRNLTTMTEAAKDRDFKIKGLEQDVVQHDEALQRATQALAAERDNHSADSGAIDTAAEQTIKSLESTVAELNGNLKR